MTQALCQLGMARWDTIEGYCVAYKIKLNKLTPSKFAALIFWYWTRNMDGEDFDKFKREIEKPPPGVNPTRGAWSDEALLAQFKNAMGQV